MAILRQIVHPSLFQWDVRLSNADIARAVGVDEETVRVRVKRMQERGFLRGFNVVPNPGVLGCEMVRVQGAPMPLERRAAAADALAALDGAHLVFQHYSGALSFVVYAPAGRPTERLATLFAAVAGPPVSVSVFRIPAPSVALDVTDWRMVAALRKDPRAPLADLASASGLGERTFRRRLERLTAGHALILDSDVDLARMEALPAMVVVRLAPGAPRTEVARRLDALPDVLFRVDAGDEARASFLARNLAAVEATRRDLAAIPGVAAVVAELHVDRRVCRAWLDEEVARRAAGEA